MDQESTSFNPKTWVSPEPIATVRESDPPKSEPEKPAKLLAIGGAGLAFLLVLGGAYVLWPTGTEAPGETVVPVADADTAPTPPKPSEPQTTKRIIPVGGMNELGFALQDMGLDTGDAFVLAQETVAALGTDGAMTISVEMLAESEETVITTLVAELDDGTAVKLARRGDGSFSRENMLDSAQIVVRNVEGEIKHNTFYVSAVEAGIPDSLVSDVAKAFAYDFNFQTEVGLGNRFRASWEERVTETGRVIGDRRLLFVELDNGSKQGTYFAFIPPDESEPRWFDENGLGIESGLMRTPVDGARITSKYGYRTHPISGRGKKHNGVDFAAPTGTPIYASGDATVLFRAPRGAAGNFIRLDHGEGMQTWYMHLNAFADDLTVGGQVKQGDIIGYVGTTGGSTGPHLHYEIRINGEPLDPLTFETTDVEKLEGDAMRMFSGHRENTLSAMAEGRAD